MLGQIRMSIKGLELILSLQVFIIQISVSSRGSKIVAERQALTLLFK